MARIPPPRTLTALLLVAFTSAAAQTDLPHGFGGISVGAGWEDIEGRFEFQRLDASSTPLDHYASQCGFRSLTLETQDGELLLTVNDFVVTDIAYVTAIQPDSDLLAVADLVMQNYGQPDRALMRNLLGQVTIDRDEVNFITLEYRNRRAVQFTIAGREQWEYRIRVRFEHHRWHENRTMRCAREKEKEALKLAEESSDPQSESQGSEQ